ncbi:biogenesis of lysosome-related organelles complex 1 subunit 4 [Rhodnius prolixus]
MEEDAQALAEEYARFIKVDASNYVKLLEEGIDETLDNLEEYTRMLDLMKSDSSVNANAILVKKTELSALFEKIKKLEIIVSIVKRNVDEMENLVINAETDLKVTTEGKLRSFLKSVIFKKKTDSSTNASVSRRNEIFFVQPNIFSTSELFGPNSD